MRKRGAKVYCEKSRARKHIFPTQEKAEQYMRNMILNARTLEDGLPQRVYYCEACGGWHMTSNAHILQKYIDDGSAVLNPKPIIVEQMPASIILHEDRLSHLRNFYNSWERKCKNAQTKIEKKQILSAKADIEKLIRNRVEKELYWVEREYFTDWRKRLVEKTLILQRRVNNILNGNTRKNRPVAVAPVIKCRYIPTQVILPNPLEIICELKDEVSVLLEQLDNSRIYLGILFEEDCYSQIKKKVRFTSRFLSRQGDDTYMAITCFSPGAEPMKSIVSGYDNIIERLDILLEFAKKDNEEVLLNRLRGLINTINSRLNLVKQGQPTSYIYTVLKF